MLSQLNPDGLFRHTSIIYPHRCQLRNRISHNLQLTSHPDRLGTVASFHPRSLPWIDQFTVVQLIRRPFDQLLCKKELSV